MSKLGETLERRVGQPGGFVGALRSPRTHRLRRSSGKTSSRGGRSVTRTLFDDLRAEPGNEARRGIGHRRVGRLNEILEVDRLLGRRGSSSFDRGRRPTW